MQGILGVAPSVALAALSAFGTFLSPKRPVAFFPCRPPEVHTPAHPLDLLFLEMNAFRYALR